MTAVTPGREAERLVIEFEDIFGDISATERKWLVEGIARLASKRASELDAAGNACLELCSRHSFATGHGDTVADIIREIDVQITERLAGKTAEEEVRTTIERESPAPDPCTHLTVGELIEWLDSPQYTNGFLDFDAANHMSAAAELLDKLIPERPPALTTGKPKP